MNRARLILAVPGNAASVEVEVQPFTIRMKDGVLSIVTPDFDDWTRTDDFDLRKADAAIKLSHDKLIITFPDEPTRTAFRQWLEGANAKAKEGYKTMWP